MGVDDCSGHASGSEGVDRRPLPLAGPDRQLQGPARESYVGPHG